MRRLAAHLVGGGDGAQDAVQETWVAALRARPTGEEDLRPWLARVLRNTIYRQARTDKRRRTRESAAREETTLQEPAAQALEHLELQRRLTEAVAALSEPYRSTVVMRFFEDKSAAEIARELGVPEGTVRWRTKEALERLRRELDQRHGSRKAWVLAWLPLTKLRPRASGVGVAIAGAMVAVLVGGVVLLGGGRSNPERPRNPDGVPRLAAGVARPTAANAFIEGRVFGPDGQPLADALVTARGAPTPSPTRMTSFERPHPAAWARTGADGGFRLQGLAPGRYTVAAAHEVHAGAFQRDVLAPAGARIDLRLGTGGHVVTGQVVEQGGGPVPGAYVWASGPASALFMAIANDAGEYRLVLEGPGFGVTAFAKGYGPATQEGRLDGSTRRDLQLPAAARVFGRVMADGRPIVGALVRLIPIGSGPRSRWQEVAITDRDGRFELVDLPPLRYRPFVQHEGLVSPERKVVSLIPGSNESVELTLVPGLMVKGRVVDASGRAVVEAGVGLAESRAGQDLDSAVGFLQETFANDDGRFVLGPLPDGAFELRPAARGYGGDSVAIQSRAAANVILRLDPMNVVTGRVFRSNGQPASGAELRGISRPPGGGGGRGGRAIADASGGFVMEALGAGEVRLTAWLGDEAVEVAPFMLAPATRRDIRIDLRPGAFLSGRVSWENGTPAIGVRVLGLGERLEPRYGDSVIHDMPTPAVRTDAEGRFTIGPFLAGRIRVAAFAPGDREGVGSEARPNQATTIVKGSERKNGLTMTISERRESLAGIVRGPSGKPLPGATVIASDEFDRRRWSARPDAARSTTGGDGRFVIERLRKGLFTVFAQHPQFADVLLHGVSSGAKDIDLRFPKPARLTGVVTTASGAPAAAYHIAVQPAAEPGGERPPITDYPRVEVANAKGAFDVERLAPRRYDVTVTTKDKHVAQALGVFLEGGETKRLRLRLAPGAVIVGHVVDGGTGAPSSGVKVNTPLPGMRSVEVHTDSQGNFRLEGVPAGEKVRVGAFRMSSRDTARTTVAIPRLGITVDAGTLRLEPRPPEN